MLARLACAHPGASTVTTDRATGAAAIALANGRLRAGENRYEKRSSTRREKQARQATGDRTLAIPFGAYLIHQTQAISAGTRPGTSTLIKVECGGRLVPFMSPTNPTQPGPSPLPLLPTGQLPVLPGRGRRAWP